MDYRIFTEMAGLWTTPEGETFDHNGRFHQFVGSPALPKPVQRPLPPVVIGGRGRKRTPSLVAKYAADFNLPLVPFEDAPEVLDNVRQACVDVDRDPASLVMSAALVTCAGATEAEIERGETAIGRTSSELRQSEMAGSPDELADKVGRYTDIGITRFYLQILDLDDLDHIAHLGSTLPS